MLNLESDLQVVESMAADLKLYLLSKTLYWPVRARIGMRRPLTLGTIGGMLLRAHQLDALRADLSGQQAARLDHAVGLAHAHLDKWVVQAEQKAVREVRARLRQWALYVDEVEDAPARYLGEYPMQARSRSTLTFARQVAAHALDGSSLITRLIVADRKMRKLVDEAPFVLDDRLEPAYPPKPYWWLYVLPTLPDD
ncbi:MAG: hypothetical protein GYB64_03670 [Chloroflexi bacterium]|nr:hypothetical protein [Chloroflexota bacterium]